MRWCPRSRRCEQEPRHGYDGLSCQSWPAILREDATLRPFPLELEYAGEAGLAPYPVSHKLHNLRERRNLRRSLNKRHPFDNVKCRGKRKEKKKANMQRRGTNPKVRAYRLPPPRLVRTGGNINRACATGTGTHFNAASAEAGHFCYGRHARLDGSLDAAVRKEARSPLLWEWINRSLSARWHRCAERSPRWQLQASNHIQGSCFGALELLKENGQKLSFFALVLYLFTLENLS